MLRPERVVVPLGPVRRQLRRRAARHYMRLRGVPVSRVAATHRCDARVHNGDLLRVRRAVFGVLAGRGRASAGGGAGDGVQERGYYLAVIGLPLSLLISLFHLLVSLWVGMDNRVAA